MIRPLKSCQRKRNRALSIGLAGHSFDTMYLEQDFGRPNGWDSIKGILGEDRYLRLVGQIDRIDEYNRDGHTYGMVIDYKSGSTSVNAQKKSITV